MTVGPFQDRTVVVTGAARGLGAASVHGLARRGRVWHQLGGWTTAGDAYPRLGGDPAASAGKSPTIEGVRR